MKRKSTGKHGFVFKSFGFVARHVVVRLMGIKENKLHIQASSLNNI